MALLARIQSKFPKGILNRSQHDVNGGIVMEDAALNGNNVEDEVSIFGLKKMSRIDIHDRMEFVEDRVDVVRLTFEDLINEMDTDLLGGIYSVLTCDDRNWQYIVFTDTVKLQNFPSWNQSRHVMIHHLADAGRDYPLFFQANMEFTVQRCQRIPVEHRDALARKYLHRGAPSPWDEPRLDDDPVAGADGEMGGHPNASAITFIQALRVIQREKRVTRVTFEGAVALVDPNDPNFWLQLLKIFKPTPKLKMTKKMKSFLGLQDPGCGDISENDEKNLPELDMGKKYLKMSVQISVMSFSNEDQPHDYDEETSTGSSDEKSDDANVWRDHLERTLEILERMAGIDEDEHIDESGNDSNRRGGQVHIVTTTSVGEATISHSDHVVDESSNHKRKSKHSSTRTRRRAHSQHHNDQEESVEKRKSRSKSSRHSNHADGATHRKRDSSKLPRRQTSRSSAHRHQQQRDEDDHTNTSGTMKKRKERGSSRTKATSSSATKNNKVSSNRKPQQSRSNPSRSSSHKSSSRNHRHQTSSHHHHDDKSDKSYVEDSVARERSSSSKKKDKQGRSKEEEGEKIKEKTKKTKSVQRNHTAPSSTTTSSGGDAGPHKKPTISALYHASTVCRGDTSFGEDLPTTSDSKLGSSKNQLTDPLEQHPFGIGSCHSVLETSNEIDIYRSRSTIMLLDDDDDDEFAGRMPSARMPSGLGLTLEEEDFITQRTNPLLRMRTHARKLKSSQQTPQEDLRPHSCHSDLAHSSSGGMETLINCHVEADNNVNTARESIKTRRRGAVIRGGSYHEDDDDISSSSGYESFADDSSCN